MNFSLLSETWFQRLLVLIFSALVFVTLFLFSLYNRGKKKKFFMNNYLIVEYTLYWGYSKHKYNDVDRVHLYKEYIHSRKQYDKFVKKNQRKSNGFKIIKQIDKNGKNVNFI